MLKIRQAKANIYSISVGITVSSSHLLFVF